MHKDATVQPAPALRRLPDVCRQTGLSAATIYRKAKRGTFPHPLKIGARASAWVAAEVDAWIRERIAGREPVLDSEATYVLVAAGMLAHGKALSTDDHQRLNLAKQRIEDAQAVLT